MITLELQYICAKKFFSRWYINAIFVLKFYILFI